jgi:FkbM family methyltransferase
MKVIFDIGANKGQNLNYFLDKADIVFAFEANPFLVKKIESDFKKFINEKKLIVRNIALVNNDNFKNIDFYIHKTKSTHSTVYPDDISKFYKHQVKCDKLSLIIQKYLEEFNISKIEYIKIDIEGADKFVLEDLLKNNILAKNLSVECHDPEVLELLISSSYNSFKFVPGPDMTFKNNIKIINKDLKEKIINFDKHSSGPYGEDIPGDSYTKRSILPYFLKNGLGWFDIHCSLENFNTKNLKYEPYGNDNYIKNRILNNLGFRYHLKNLIPSLIKGIKRRIRKGN